MSGSRHPFPWPASQPATLRASLHAKLDLAARVGAQIGIVSDQWRALRAGDDVQFSAEQLASFYPGARAQHPSLPESFDAAAAWRLEGDDELVPVD